MTLNPRLSPSGPLLDTNPNGGAVVARDIAINVGLEQLDTTPAQLGIELPSLVVKRSGFRYRARGSAMFRVSNDSSTVRLSFAVQWSNDDGTTWTNLGVALREFNGEGEYLFREDIVSRPYDGAPLLPVGVESAVVKCRLVAFTTGGGDFRWISGVEGIGADTQTTFEEELI